MKTLSPFQLDYGVLRRIKAVLKFERDEGRDRVILNCGHLVYTKGQYKARCKECVTLLESGMIPHGFKEPEGLFWNWIPNPAHKLP